MYLFGNQYIFPAVNPSQCDCIPCAVWSSKSGGDCASGVNRNACKYGGGGDVLQGDVPERGEVKKVRLRCKKDAR